MQSVGKSKIGKLSAKGIKYPQFRLPQQYSDTIGKMANVFETNHDGKRAFLIVTEEAVSNKDTVLKPREEVLKPEPFKDSDQRLSTLESQILELKSLILENEKLLQNLSKKEAPESGFEPESEPRQGSMIGRYTTRACISAVTA